MTRTIDRVKTSRFLKKADLMDLDLTLTIDSVIEQDVARRHEPEKLKHVVHFRDTDKALVLGLINAELIAEALGTLDMDLWPGELVTLFYDPNVCFDGVRVGGIRVRHAFAGSRSVS